MSDPEFTVKQLETRLFDRISTAQRNGLSASEAVAVGVAPLLEWIMTLETQRALPTPGAPLRCLICAYEKPWGVFDSKTGAAVCMDCRDKARR
jgi:hypothetical protein